MLKNIVLILSICLLSTAACLKTQIQTNAANNTVPATNSIAESANSKIDGGKNNENAVAVNPNQKVFRGMINGTSFEMRLTRDGDKLSGTYFYTKIRRDLKLAGTIDAAGKFKLQEIDAAGKKTGEWEGTWKDDPNSNGIALEGSWKKPSASDNDSFSFYATEQVIEFTNGIRFIDKTVKEENKAKRSTIESVYPEISGVDAATAAKFNQAVKKIVADSNDEYRKSLADFTAADIKSLPGGAGLSNEVSYDVALANNDLVSLTFYDYSYTGGAHGNTSSTTINYDLKNNRELKLADVFEPNANYLKAISDYAIADLKPRVGEMSDDEWLSKGAAAEAENFQSWNLTNKGLMITFDQYQVAAYAAGPQTVVIPYAKLQTILRKDGLAEKLGNKLKTESKFKVSI